MGPQPPTSGLPSREPPRSLVKCVGHPPSWIVAYANHQGVLWYAGLRPQKPLPQSPKPRPHSSRCNGLETVPWPLPFPLYLNRANSNMRTIWQSPEDTHPSRPIYALRKRWGCTGRKSEPGIPEKEDSEGRYWRVRRNDQRVVPQHLQTARCHPRSGHASL